MKLNNSRQIFSGIRVLDFCQVIAGSYATTILGDMGAEILKIEQPGTGDTLRNIGPKINGESGFFILNNRNKKSICIDLKSAKGIELIKELVPHCDVVTENFKPGVMEKLGLGYDAVKKIKPGIIYASVSGYGHNNDYSGRTAYDLVMQGETGLASLNGFPETERPLRSPLSVADYGAGTYCALAVISALYHKKNTGVGQYIDVAMYDSLISFMDNTFVICDTKKDEITPETDLESIGLKSTGNRHPDTSPHGFYKTLDGFVAHCSLTNQMWGVMLKIIGKEEFLNHPDFKNISDRKINWRKVDGLVEEWTTKHTTAEVVKIWEHHRLPCGKIRGIDEVYNDPHNEQRGVFHEVNHPVAGKLKITNLPIKFSETPASINTPSPSLGEHTYEIFLNILGYTKQQVDELAKQKVLFVKK